MEQNKKEVPEFNPETHKWDFKTEKVVVLTPEELAGIARRKRKGDLDKRLKPLINGGFVYHKTFGHRVRVVKGERRVVHMDKEIATWDRDDLDDLEQKIIKMEAVKKKLDDEAAKNKPIEERRREYQKIDHLFLEALAESGGVIVDGAEKPSEKMQAYLKLRADIKTRIPK